MAKHAVAGLLLALCLCSCKKTFNDTANRSVSDVIIADYVKKELKGAPCTVYLYTDTNSNRLYLADDDRQFESGRSYVYFIDEEPSSPWPHPCRSVWIDRSNGNFSVERGESPLRGTGKWLLVNNFWNEDPRTGSSGCLVLNHPDYTVQPCFYYRFDGDNLSVEHQCIEMSSSSVELSINIDQSDRRLDILAQDPDANGTGTACLQHYGFKFHLDSLYVPIDSVNTRRLEQIPVHYRAQTAAGTVNNSFILPTRGSGKIRL
ncbi:MAG: hypothetical protein NC324_07005 [Bacteroides sp.]|nr:hypothetical protein [Bacteroides sp.]